MAQDKIFSEEEFITVVKKFHPVIKLAANNVKAARWDVTASRAGFDPEWRSAMAQKRYEGTMYYDQALHELKIPTWYGVDIYAGQEQIDGSRTNPEETQGRLNYIGFSVPLIQNLAMDRRRAALVQAKNYFQLSQVEQQTAINNLLKEALEAYWNWWQHYHVLELTNKALLNAEKRLQLVRIAYEMGDRPAIDTVEARTQVQSLQIRVSEVLSNYMGTQLLLSSFLWAENGEQVNLPTDIVPAINISQETLALEEILDAAADHPEMREYNYVLKNLRIDKKLKFQSLLPEVRLKYNQLGRDFSKTINAAWFTNNYNYGIDVSVPLRFSRGRGEYGRARIEIANAEIEQRNKQVQLELKVKEYFTEWQQTSKQLSLQQNLVNNYAALLRAEEVRFSNGESNLFMVNSRELNALDAERKLAEIVSKNRSAFIKLQWAGGLLGR